MITRIDSRTTPQEIVSILFTQVDEMVVKEHKSIEEAASIVYRRYGERAFRFMGQVKAMAKARQKKRTAAPSQGQSCFLFVHHISRARHEL